MSWQQAFPLFLQPPDARPLREVEQDILDELEFHLAMRTCDNVNAGMSADEARQDAEQRFGNFARIHQACRQTLLGERIMLQRVQAILTLALLGAVVLLGWQSYRSQQANEAATARMLQALGALTQTTTNTTRGNAAAAPAETGDMANQAPTVVQTVPRSGDRDVDPALTEIRVTYNQQMADGNWSWSQISADSFPETTGKPYYEHDGKTCVLPVKLAPGKTYTLLLNSKNFHNFTNAAGRPAVPYTLQFQTRK